MKIVKDSHLDHGLSKEVVEFILDYFKNKDGFFIESVDLPNEIGTVPCGLYGPIMGDDAVAESEVVYEARNGRSYTSRMVEKPFRQVRTVTVIAGPHEGESCVLYTAFGGPLAEQEPGDPSCKDLEKSKQFWSAHALAR